MLEWTSIPRASFSGKLGRVKLEQCSGCNGFLPATVSACPHCDQKRSKLGAVALVLGSGAIAFTLMACYGAAPCAEGNNCQPNAPTPDTSGTPHAPNAPSLDGGK